MDFITTYIALNIPSKLVEGNPVMSKLMSIFGLIPALIIMKIFGIGMAVYLYMISSVLGLGIMSAIYAYIVINNIRLIRARNKLKELL